MLRSVYLCHIDKCIFSSRSIASFLPILDQVCTSIRSCLPACLSLSLSYKSRCICTVRTVYVFSLHIFAYCIYRYFVYLLIHLSIILSPYFFLAIINDFMIIIITILQFCYFILMFLLLKYRRRRERHFKENCLAYFLLDTVRVIRCPG